MNYVCGFLFETDLQRVLLRLKARPAWQRGKLNGIGGKVESGETPFYAMRREAREETGVEDSHLQAGWELFRTERFRSEAPDGNIGVAVHFFAAQLRAGLDLEQFAHVVAVTMDKEAEPNVPIYYSTVPIMAREGRLLYNLEYLLPMGRVWLESGAHRRPIP